MSALVILLLYFLGIVFGLFIFYFIIKTAVKHGTKDALKQSEYYLEIIAKRNNDKQ